MFILNVHLLVFLLSDYCGDPKIIIDKSTVTRFQSQPGYPYNYNPNWFCFWTIHGTDDGFIFMRFIQFSVAPFGDFFSLGHGLRNSTETRVLHFNGDFDIFGTFTVTLNSSTAWATFETTSDSSYWGFVTDIELRDRYGKIYEI